MNVQAIYKCLTDPQRIRILNLLEGGPLCVCHLMDILELEQVRVSKQLIYMKKMGLLRSERAAQWMIYRLTGKGQPILEENLRCLRAMASAQLPLEEDLRKRSRIVAGMEGSELPEAVGACCCGTGKDQ